MLLLYTKAAADPFSLDRLHNLRRPSCKRSSKIVKASVATRLESVSRIVAMPCVSLSLNAARDNNKGL